MKKLLIFFFQRRETLFLIFFLTLFIAMAIIKTPFPQVFEYNPDEGINLVKASLLLNGFRLYKEIWSDQPPLLTLILSFWFKLFGLSVYSGRLLILFFSAILLWAFYQTVKAFWGNLCAFIASVFLSLSALYLKLSVSVMIGIPALCFAMLSIYCVALYKKLYLKRLLALSAIFMALSLQTKLFTAFLVPIIILEIIQAKKQNRIFAVLLWLGILLALYLSIAIIFFNFNLPLFIQQLLKPHLSASAFIKPEYNFPALYGMLSQDYDIILLALIGILLLIKQKKWQYLFPVFWLALAFAILIKHRPVWQHHYLLISIPLCWLAAINFSGLLFTDKKRVRKNVPFLAVACLAILIIIRVPLKYDRMLKSVDIAPPTQERTMIELLSKYKKATRWIVTDRPIFAFYANILIPPELAVFSLKRMLTGQLTAEYVIYILEKYKPEQILLARFQDYNEGISSNIQRDYSKIYFYSTSGTEVTLYIRKDVIKSLPTSAGEP